MRGTGDRREALDGRVRGSDHLLGRRLLRGAEPLLPPVVPTSL